MQEVEFKTAKDIEQKSVCIVRYGPPSPADGLRPGEYYQVTIDPDRFSPSKDFIRCGTSPGDELVGWQKAQALVIVDVLGLWDGEQPPTMNWTRN